MIWEIRQNAINNGQNLVVIPIKTEKEELNKKKLNRYKCLYIERMILFV